MTPATIAPTILAACSWPPACRDTSQLGEHVARGVHRGEEGLQHGEHDQHGEGRQEDVQRARVPVQDGREHQVHQEHRSQLGELAEEALLSASSHFVAGTRISG